MKTSLIIYSGIAGITVVLGGLLARLFKHHIKESPVKEEVTHTLIAMGGGVLLSAVALVLIPKGIGQLDTWPVMGLFLLGGLLFMILDKWLNTRRGKVGSLLAMLMDFIPEALVLGAVFSHDTKTAMLLALFIGLQNLPEAFMSYRDLSLSGFKENRLLIIFLLISSFGIISALLGHYYLAEMPNTTASLMVFASGGILYLLFQDVVPESKLDNNYLTSVGAVIGFAIGLLGEMLI